MRATDQYMDALVTKINDPKKFDTKYIHFDSIDDAWKIGNLPFTILNNNFIANDKSYTLTPGLQQLLFIKKPVRNKVTKSDILAYLEIIESGDVLHKGFDKNRSIDANRSDKYRLIKNLQSSTKKSGTGLMKYSENKIDYKYWDDPNELVDRLRLLIGSQQAGNNNHNNEIVSILEELQERKIIL